MNFLIVLLWIIDILLFINFIWLAVSSNFTLGIVMVFIVAMVLLLLLVFRKPLASLTSQGFFKFVKIVFFICWGIFFSAVAFVAVSGYFNMPTYTESTVIVPGAGLHGEKISMVLKQRLDATLLYYSKNDNVNIIVTGGQGPQEDIPEAVAMKNYLIQNGIPEKKIFIEDKSTSTMENLTFAKEVMVENNIDTKKPIVCVTNAFHCYRTAKYASELGFQNISTLPAKMHIGNIASCYMREALAVLYVWVFG